MTDPSFIGRTIVGFEMNDYHRRWLLRLDDGSAVEFSVEGYEGDGDVVHLTDEVIEQRARELAEFKRAEAEDRERQRRAAERRRVETAAMRAKLDPEAFEKWRRENYPTVMEMLRDTWTDPKLTEQIHKSWRQP